MKACLHAGFLRGIIYYWLIVAISHALDYYEQYEEKALAASQLESQLAQVAGGIIPVDSTTYVNGGVPNDTSDN